MTRANKGLGGDHFHFHLLKMQRDREVGASIVEFALVVPLLMMLVFGIMEFGIAMAQKATVASAAREGARFGSVNLYASAMGSPRDCADVVEKARENAVTIGMAPSDLAVTVTRGSDPASASTLCSAAANSASASGSSLTAPPCQGAAETDILYVHTSFGGRLDIPLVTSHSVTLETTGASRCEYN